MEKIDFGHIHLYQRWSKLQRPWNFRRKLHRKTSFIVFDEKTAAYISWLLMRQRAFKQQNIDKKKFVIHCQFTFYDMHLRFSKYVDVIVMYDKNAAIYKWIVLYYQNITEQNEQIAQIIRNTELWCRRNLPSELSIFCLFLIVTNHSTHNFKRKTN